MYSVYRIIPNGNKIFLGTIDHPADILEFSRIRNRRNLNQSHLIIEPN
jgi:hypothetical protein